MKAIVKLTLALVLIAAAIPTPAAAAETRPLRFLPQWSPQAQFAGYYVALDHGLYAKAGVDVEILEGGPRLPPAAALESGKTDLATMWLATGITRRAKGAPLVNLAQVVRKSSLMLVARKSSGIAKPEDLDGRKVSLWNADFQVQPRALFKKLGVAPVVISQSGTMNLLIQGGVDAASAMWYNEYHVLKMSGLDSDELTSFFLGDYGFDFPEDGVYALASTTADRAAECRAFVEASLAGWTRAFAKPEEALESVARRMTEAGLGVNVTHQRWMLNCMKSQIAIKGKKTIDGALREEDFRLVAETLKEAGEIESIPAFAEFHPGRDAKP